jgi:hypothetical protein
MSKKKVTKLSKKQFRSLLLKLIKKHGKVKLLFQERNLGLYNSMSDAFRKRIIYDDGYCVVAYRSNGYPHFSNFTESCFMPVDYKTRDYPPIGLEETIDEMLEHDKGYIKPIQIQYGKWYRRRINL